MFNMQFEIQKFDTKKKVWLTVEVANRVNAGKKLAVFRAKEKGAQWRMRVQPLQDRVVAA